MDAHSPVRIIAATRNPAKLRELQRVVGGLAAIEPLPSGISLPATAIDQLESYRDFADIACQKAVVWSKHIGGDRIVIASDGGLLVPAIGLYWDATRTRRFAGEGASDLQRAHRLLELTGHLDRHDRLIRWLEAVHASCNGESLRGWIAEGNVGRLATGVAPEAIARAGGFWVSALWQCPEFDHRLLVDLNPAERDRLRDHWRELQEPIRQWIRAGCPKWEP